MSLEQYMFPFGKREVAKREQLIKQATKLSLTVSRQWHELDRTHQYIESCHKKIYEMQLRSIEPIVDMVCQDMMVRAETFTVFEMDAQEFRVALRTPRVTFQELGRAGIENYRQEVIDHCAFKLAKAIMQHLTEEVNRSG